jgi:hypothetical protein
MGTWQRRTSHLSYLSSYLFQLTSYLSQLAAGSVCLSTAAMFCSVVATSTCSCPSTRVCTRAHTSCVSLTTSQQHPRLPHHPRPHKRASPASTHHPIPTLAARRVAPNIYRLFPTAACSRMTACRKLSSGLEAGAPNMSRRRCIHRDDT